jgi:hypothetical protein
MGFAHLGRTRPSWASAHGLKHGVAAKGQVRCYVTVHVPVPNWRWVRVTVSEGQHRAGREQPPRHSSLSFSSCCLSQLRGAWAWSWSCLFGCLFALAFPSWDQRPVETHTHTHTRFQIDMRLASWGQLSWRGRGPDTPLSRH